MDQSREKELIGGLKNALERGESLAKAKQTFINAGYQPSEVATAVQKLPTAVAPITTTTAPTPIGKPGENLQPKSPQTSTTQITESPKKKSKLLIIIIIIVSALILIGAGILGVFWNSWFGS